MVHAVDVRKDSRNNMGDLVYKYPSESKDQIVQWLDQYHFQAFVTLTLDNDEMINYYLDTKLLEWVRKIQKIEEIQICYLGIISRHRGHSRKHIHLLMCGKNRFGKSIKDCDPKTFTNSWYTLSDVSLIDGEENQDRIIKYLVHKNMGYSFEMVTPYNTKLLESTIRDRSKLHN
jgi:hypothetical protein